MTKRLLILVGGVMACWLLLALPARHFGAGEDAVIQSGLAALLCLVPAVLVMAWAGWAFRQNAEQQTYVVLGGGGLRLFFVLGAALFLTEVAGVYRGQSGFLIWVCVFYLFTLVLEVGLLVTALAKKAVKS